MKHGERRRRRRARGLPDGADRRREAWQTLSAAVVIEAPAASVFAYVDNIENLGAHMAERSTIPMFGSRLTLRVLSSARTGVGATYQYTGRVLGLPIDVVEPVTAYQPGRQKAWETQGRPRLPIMGAYRMRADVEPQGLHRSTLTMSIAYTLPRVRRWRLLGRLLAPSYARWCLRAMVRDAKRAFERDGAT